MPDTVTINLATAFVALAICCWRDGATHATSTSHASARPMYELSDLRLESAAPRCEIIGTESIASPGGNAGRQFELDRRGFAVENRRPEGAVTTIAAAVFAKINAAHLQNP